jgi:threonine dehydrogenase-like Zn-dependent dehydrogenase
MKGLVLNGRGGIDLREVARPERAGECLVRVTAAGICGTDLQMLEGYAGFDGIPGHEFVGIVEAAPSPAEAAWVGRRVVGDINIGCRRCRWCAAGVKEHCLDRRVLGIRGHDGAFADYLTLPSTNLHRLPDEVDDESAVFVEPVAACCRIFEQLPIGKDASIAVLGDGRMGLLVAQVLATTAANVTVLGRHDHKLDLARALGLNARHSQDELPASSRYDIVVDVTGRAEGLARALELVRPRGIVVLKSTFHGEAPLESWPIVVDEISIVGSRCGPFQPAIDLLAASSIKVKPLISRVTTLEEHQAAFDEARRALKVLFVP